MEEASISKTNGEQDSPENTETAIDTEIDENTESSDQAKTDEKTLTSENLPEAELEKKHEGQPAIKHSPIILALRAIAPYLGIIISLVIEVVAYIAVRATAQDSKYLSGSVASALIYPLLILSFILPLVSLFVFKGTKQGIPAIHARFFSILPAAASVYLLFFLLTKGTGKWDTAFILFSLLCLTFFIFKIFNRFEALKTLLSLSVFVLCTMIIALLYLDFTIELNSHFKLAVQFGSVALIFGTIADSRAVLSRISTGGFIYLKSISLSLSTLCCTLVFSAFSKQFTIFPDSYRVFSMLYLAYAISTVAELASINAGTRK